MSLNLNDKDIISVIKKGEKRTVLTYLYNEYAGKVLNIVQSRGGSLEDAQDIFQDVLLIFYKKALENSLNEDTNVGGFLIGIAQKMWYTKAKRNEMMQRHHGEIKKTELQFTDNYEFVFSKERGKLINEILEVAGEKCKKLLELVLFEDYSMKELAEEFNFSSVDTAKATHYRCRQKLVKQFKDKKHLIEQLRIEK
jgi:RNA polymerase sigma factor (sigma-70 family)